MVEPIRDWTGDMADSIYLNQISRLHRGNPEAGFISGWGKRFCVLQPDMDSTDSCFIYLYAVNSSQQLQLFQKLSCEVLIFKIMNEDINGDGLDELLISTSNNMNGNNWTAIWVWESGKFARAGTICCGYHVSPDKKEIYEEHEGSWYMDRTKTVYEWVNNRLVEISRLTIHLISESNLEKGSRLICEKNPGKKPEGLKRVYNKKYRQDNPKQAKLLKEYYPVWVCGDEKK